MKKGICLILALIMTLCMAGSALAEQSYTAGTYTATAQGNNGDVTVEVEVSDSEIVSITVTEHAETPGVGTPALEMIPAAIVEGQTLAVDAVTGATNSSVAVLTAVEAALTEAGADIEALKAPAAVADEAAFPTARR